MFPFTDEVQMHCAAVLASEIAEQVKEKIDQKLDEIMSFTDS